MEFAVSVAAAYPFLAFGDLRDLVLELPDKHDRLIDETSFCYLPIMESKYKINFGL